MVGDYVPTKRCKKIADICNNIRSNSLFVANVFESPSFQIQSVAFETVHRNDVIGTKVHTLHTELVLFAVLDFSNTRESL
jgi:hypothetical protein